MKDKKTHKRVTFTSLEEFDRVFFPSLPKEEEEEDSQDESNPTAKAAEVAQHALSSLVR